MLLNKIISSIIEIVGISFIPFIWWFISARRKKIFLIGLD